MGVVLAVTTGLVVWLVLWALGAKGFDAFMLTVLAAVLGVTGRTLLQYAPGRQE